MIPERRPQTELLLLLLRLLHALCIVHCALYNCALYIVRASLFVHCALCFVRPALCIVQFALRFVHCALCIAHATEGHGRPREATGGQDGYGKRPPRF